MGMVQEQNMEKQMGCMAGFLQIFDRQQIITGKRLYATKRLPLSTVSFNNPLQSSLSVLLICLCLVFNFSV
jgi:hypothetical protein